MYRLSSRIITSLCLGSPRAGATSSASPKPSHVLFAVMVAHLGAAGSQAATAGKPAFVGSPVYFEQNVGQHDRGVYRAKGPGFSVEFEDGRVRILTRRGEPTSMVFVNARRTHPMGESRTAMRVDYLRGSSQREWRMNVPTFKQIRYANLYQGIDSVFYGAGGALEYDFVVGPGADPRGIRFRIDGAERVQITGSGELVASAANGVAHQHAAPRAYQWIGGRRKPVEARFVDDHGEIGFRVGAYDRTRTLVIDPVLSFSEYIGDTMDDQGIAVATDTAGNMYVLGSVRYASTAPGTFGSDDDAFLYKYSPDGSDLLYVAVVGGTHMEYPRGLAVDGSGKAYITGSTSSSDFPVSANAYSMTPIKTPNAFICVLDTTLPVASSLVYSRTFQPIRRMPSPLTRPATFTLLGLRVGSLSRRQARFRLPARVAPGTATHS